MRSASLFAFALGLSVALSALPAWANPIPISSIEELALIGNDGAYPLSGSYVLTQDIDASTFEGNFAPIGDYDAFEPFTGTFDGDGHTISGLTINRSGQDIVGLFGFVEEPGIVRNLTLEGITVTGRDDVGGVIALNWGGRVVNCHVSGTVTGVDRVGGVVGHGQQGNP